MRFKLDENFGTRTEHIFQTAGHDVQTVRQEALQGASDIKLFDVCVREQRCLVTLDLDFADVTRFRSVRTAGIVVIRVSRNPSLPLLESLIRQFLTALERMPISGDLWIVEAGRIRVHQQRVNGLDEEDH